MNNAKDIILSASERFSASDITGSVFVGFDGFIDNILRPVKTRINNCEFEPVSDIETFSERIRSGAGKSINIEIVKDRSSMGGNGPIMANSLSLLGNSTDIIGSFGKNEILPVFKPFTDRCRTALSICEPGITDAFEFNDGKVMFNYPQSVLDISWNLITQTAGLERLKDMIGRNDYLALVNWTMIPQMNDIFGKMTELLSNLPGRKTVYIDLTDPKKRSREDLKHCMERLLEMSDRADVILGLNESEAEQCAAVTGAQTAYSDIKELAESIHKVLPLRAIVIHSIKQAAICAVEGSFLVNGPYTPDPKLSTGAGDVFNAGFYAGYIAGLNLEQCLVTGVCNSGYYVRNAKPADKRELIGFMKAFAEET